MTQETRTRDGTWLDMPTWQRLQTSVMAWLVEAMSKPLPTTRRAAYRIQKHVLVRERDCVVRIRKTKQLHCTHIGFRFGCQNQSQSCLCDGMTASRLTPHPSCGLVGATLSWGHAHPTWYNSEELRGTPSGVVSTHDLTHSAPTSLGQVWVLLRSVRADEGCRWLLMADEG